METDTWPRDEVKTFLADKVCVKVNPGKGNDQKKRMDDFGVKAVPTMILMSPEGKELVRAAGKPPPGQFTAYFVNQRWNDMVDAEKAQDWKAAAEHAFILTTWFPGTEAAERARSILAAHAEDPTFRAALEAAKTANERAVLLGKANLLLQDKKKAEAIDAFKAVIAAHPDSKEAEAAKAALKKLGVKLDVPAKK
ncbi:MAG: hypothetical protein HYY18_14200 [Planctomycetes bacterium]|nr:hypothetical protein [Planctomycetota bacterium]